MGAVTPLANDLETTWKKILAGESGIAPISIFDASGFATRIAGEVKNFPFKTWRERDPLLKDAFRGTLFALEAAEEALRQAAEVCALRALQICPMVGGNGVRADRHFDVQNQWRMDRKAGRGPHDDRNSFERLPRSDGDAPRRACA